MIFLHFIPSFDYKCQDKHIYDPQTPLLHAIRQHAEIGFVDLYTFLAHKKSQANLAWLKNTTVREGTVDIVLFYLL